MNYEHNLISDLILYYVWFQFYKHFTVVIMNKDALNY